MGLQGNTLLQFEFDALAFHGFCPKCWFQFHLEQGRAVTCPVRITKLAVGVESRAGRHTVVPERTQLLLASDLVAMRPGYLVPGLEHSWFDLWKLRKFQLQDSLGFFIKHGSFTQVQVAASCL